MQSIARGVMLERKFKGVDQGVVRADHEYLLVDCPLFIEEGQEWLAQLAEYGSPKFLALLDEHPERVLGARELGIPIIAHDATRVQVSGWPDSFKGSTHPIGALSDQLKKTSGVQDAVPEVSFAEQMTLRIGDREILFLHRPGPSQGSIWIVVPDAEAAFIGDTVTVAEPPYIGGALVSDWLDSLDELRSSTYRGYRLISSRDGVIDRPAINAMARFVRKIHPALRGAEKKADPINALAKLAIKWMKDYDLPASRRDIVALRLQSGLIDLYTQLHPIED